MSTLITVIKINTRGFNSDGTDFTEDLYFTTHTYNPPTGPPPEGGGDLGVQFYPRILNTPLKAFSMGCLAFDSSSVQTIGDLELVNVNGDLDYLLARETIQREAIYYRGFQSQDFEDFVIVGRLIQDKFIASAQDRIKLPFVDSLGVLNDPVPRTKYPDTIPSTALQGSDVPEVWGKIKSQKLEPYDKPNEIFVVSTDGTMGGIDTVRDNGIRIPVGTPPTPSTYAVITTAEGYTAVQFVSNTAGVITIDIRSSESPGIDVIFDRVADAYGLNIDTSNLIAFDADNGRNVGVLLTDPVTGTEILEGVLKCVNGWYWQDNNGDLKVGQLVEASGDAKVFLSDNNTTGDFLKISDPGAGVRGSAGYQKNWYKHEPSQIAAGALDVDKEVLIRDYRYTIDDLGGDIEIHPVYKEAALARKPLPCTMSNTNQTIYAFQNQAALYASQRWGYKVNAIIDAAVVAELQPNDIIALNVKDFNLVDPYDIDVHGRPLAYNTWLMHHQTRLIPMPSSGDNTAVPAAVIDNLSTIQIRGNSWYAFEYPYTITADTVLEFDFLANIDKKGSPSVNEGEIIAIGVCTSTGIGWSTQQDRYFQVYGTQSGGVQDYNNYNTVGEWKRYKIPIGQYITGFHAYIRIAGDYDNFNIFLRQQDARFRNVRLREDGFLNTTLTGAEFNLGDNEASLTTWGA